MVSVSRAGLGRFTFNCRFTRFTGDGRCAVSAPTISTSYRYTCTATGIAGDLPVSVPVWGENREQGQYR